MMPFQETEVSTMKQKSKLSTKKIVLVGLLAALTAACSALRIKVPSDIVGTSAFHLGNILCALCGILLGPWLGGFAAGLGSALHDIVFDPSYISECWLTFLLKFPYGMAAGLVCHLGKKDCGYTKALLGTVAGAVTYALLYLAKSYFYSGLLLQGLSHSAALAVVISKLPATVFNAAVAILAAPLLAMTLKKALKSGKLRE